MEDAKAGEMDIAVFSMSTRLFRIAWITVISLSLGASAWGGTIVEAVDSGTTDKILPKVISQPPPVFPPSLARAGADGVVLVTFTVDEAGDVRDAEVVESDVRQLNSYALKAVAQWKFIPGAKNGHTAPFRLRAPVEFGAKAAALAAHTTETGSRLTPLSPPAPATSASGAQIAVATTDQSLSLDTVPAARRQPMPVYPYDMLIKGRSGWANASFVVDYMGRPLFTNPAGASDRAFALSVVAMVEASEFTPGMKGKSRVMSPLKEHYEFPGESSFDPEARRVLAELRKAKPSIPNTLDLDEKPKVLAQVSPVYPRALKDDGLTGQAEIEFVIDRDGRVLFPRIISASHEDFGWAAATAISQWRFQPPRRGGQVVAARMTVPVLFTAQKLAESD